MKKKEEEVKYNPDFQAYYKKYANEKMIPLIQHRLNSLFHTSKTSLDNQSQNDIVGWLKNPRVNYAKLINLSKELYKTSGEYRSIINYYADMARFYYVFDPVYSTQKQMSSKGKVLKDLSNLSAYFDKMNVKHELSKIFKTCVIEDVYFGYEIEDKDNYFLLKLDPNYCRINGIADGMFTYEFNLHYFVGREELLKSFPEEFVKAFRIHSIDKDLQNQWFQPSFTKSVCFKFNELDETVVPPFATMFEPLLELNDYKKLKKVSAKINNYMLLHQKVPMHDNNKGDYQADNFAISPDTMNFFNDMANESLPDEIGAIVSPMDITPIELVRDDKNDKVAEATRDVFNSSGVSSFIFNNDKNSTGGLSYSTRKDELVVMAFYRQAERWLNRKIRFSTEVLSKNQWKVSLLDVTGMSEDKYLEQLTKSGSFGFAVRGRIAALHGQDYHTLMNSLELENEILELDIKMVPLASSHTGGLNSAVEQKLENDKKGRPTKDDGEITDSTQANRDSNSNALKGGGN